MSSTTLNLGPLGLSPNQLAEFTEPVPLEAATGRYMQVRIQNSQGRMEVRGLRIWAQETGRNTERKEGHQG
jgi:hypothetical protein